MSSKLFWAPVAGLRALLTLTPSTLALLTLAPLILAVLTAPARADCPSCQPGTSQASGAPCGCAHASYTAIMPRLSPPSYGPTGRDVYHCGLAAPQYPVPFPTPRPTVYTHLWYPPMMPHNSLPHYRGSYSFRHGPGMSRTTVLWTPTKIRNAFDWLHNAIELPR